MVQEVTRLSLRSEAMVEETIARASLAAERAVAVARVAFYSAVLLRFFFVAELSSARLALTTIPLAASIAFSLGLMARIKTPPRGRALWLFSVLLDAFTVFSVLLPNVLWPSPEYKGILFIPDTCGVLVATVGAGFRLSPLAAAAGGIANMAGLLALVHIDRLISGPRFEVAAGSVSIYLLLVGGMTLLAMVYAVTSRRLAHRGALAAWRAEQAKRGLGALLAESHDIGSLLTAATLDAEQISEGLRARDADGRGKLAKAAQRLLDDLRQVRSVAIDVKERALGDLISLDQRVPVEVGELLSRTRKQLGTLYPHVRLHLPEPFPSELSVLVAGGETTFQRIMLNLLLNACESNCASIEIRLHLDAAHSRLRLHIRDDGAAFPETVLRGESPSTKPGGTGVGLSIVRGLVEASGGLFHYGNSEQGGAEAVLTLPLRPAQRQSIVPPAPASSDALSRDRDHDDDEDDRDEKQPAQQRPKRRRIAGE